MSEDEKSIAKQLTYCQNTYFIIGSCRPELPNLKCLKYYVQNVGDDEGTYMRGTGIEFFFIEKGDMLHKK